MTPDQIKPFVSSHSWPALAIVVIAVLARAAKAPALGSPFARVPVRWRPHVVGALGVLSGILEAITTGTPWLTAIGTGVLSAGLAIAVHGWLGGLSGETPPPAPPPQLGAPAVIDTVLRDLPPAASSEVRPVIAEARSPDLDFGVKP